MASNFDPSDLNPDEVAWQQQKNAAIERRQRAIASIPQLTPAQHDAQREAQMEQQRARAKSITPGSLQGDRDPLDVDLNVSVPNVELPTNSVQLVQKTPIQMSDIVFWVCNINE